MDEPVDEVCVRNAAGLPEFRVHADLGEAGDGVDLVNDDLSVVPEKEIHSCHSFAAKDFECLDRGRLDLLNDLGRKFRGNLQDRSVFVQILGLVGIKLVLGNDLSGRGGNGIFVSQHRTLELPPLNVFFHEDLRVVPEGIFGSIDPLALVFDFMDAYR